MLGFQKKIPFLFFLIIPHVFSHPARLVALNPPLVANGKRNKQIFLQNIGCFFLAGSSWFYSPILARPSASSRFKGGAAGGDVSAI